MNEPPTESAVQTTPPMSIAATIPALPLRPTATRTSEVMMRVMMVMPLTGLEPTIAMALAATVVKRNEITATISSGMDLRLCRNSAIMIRIAGIRSAKRISKVGSSSAIL